MLFILGEAYFKAMDNPLLYFQVLMLSAQFEAVSTKFCLNTMWCCRVILPSLAYKAVPLAVMVFVRPK